MSEDRKYKQRGYQEEERQKPSHAGGQERARGPAFTAFRGTFRCDACGADLESRFEIRPGSRCPRCGADLHSCRNCLHLDPSARFECSRPIVRRVESKQEGNACPEFEPRRVQVKETTFSTSPRPEDARKALENLFRRK